MYIRLYKNGHQHFFQNVALSNSSPKNENLLINIPLLHYQCNVYFWLNYYFKEFVLKYCNKIECHLVNPSTHFNSKSSLLVNKATAGKFFQQFFFNLMLRFGTMLKMYTYTFLSFSNMPFIFSMALSAASWVSKCTKP